MTKTLDVNTIDQLERARKALYQYEVYTQLVAEAFPDIYHHTVHIPYRYLLLPFQARLVQPFLNNRSALMRHVERIYGKKNVLVEASPDEVALMGGAFTMTMENLTFDMEFFMAMRAVTEHPLESPGIIRHVGAKIMTLAAHEELIQDMATVGPKAKITDIPGYISRAYQFYHNDQNWFGPGSAFFQKVYTHAEPEQYDRNSSDVFAGQNPSRGGDRPVPPTARSEEGHTGQHPVQVLDGETELPTELGDSTSAACDC